MIATNDRVAALVVTYFPDASFPQRIDALRSQVARIVIIDNGSDPSSLAVVVDCLRHDGITLHQNADNLGVATALNQGISLLSTEGYSWIVTLDQDSTATPGFVEALLSLVADHPERARIGLVGANREDAGAGGAPHRWLRPKTRFPYFERVACESIGPDGVTIVITSGTLINMDAYHRLGPFRDDMFIDFVDAEYCLRARKSHYFVLVSCQARLLHRLGEKRRHVLFGLNFMTTNHNSLRRYYIFRNGMITLKTYGVIFPHWTIFQCLAFCEILAGLVLFEDQKWPKLKACAWGFWDGILGRTGPNIRPL